MTERVPAKSIDDFLLDEQCYKADFELAGRWDTWVTELERLSLLGIGAYGFLISTIALDKGAPTPFMQGFQRYAIMAVCGILCFAVSAASALACNSLACKCMRWQVDILRGFAKLGSTRLTEEERGRTGAFVRETQLRQKNQLKWNRGLLATSALFLCLGAVLTAFTFSLVLLTRSGKI